MSLTCFRRRAAATAGLLAAGMLAATAAIAQTPAPADGADSGVLRMMQSAATAHAGSELMSGGMLQTLQALHGRLGKLAHGDADGLYMPSSGRIAAELAGYRTRLRITASQLPLWNAFTDSVQDAADNLRHAIDEQHRSGTPQPLLGVEFAAVRSLADTAGPLSAALSDEQKATVRTLVSQGLHGLGDGR
jgi:hypothetical protein